MLALTDLRVACEHKQYDEHIYQTIPNYTGFRQVTVPVTCPGGRPATLEDLAELGIRMDWCVRHKPHWVTDQPCERIERHMLSRGCVYRPHVLIPLSQMVAGEEE